MKFRPKCTPTDHLVITMIDYEPTNFFRSSTKGSNTASIPYLDMSCFLQRATSCMALKLDRSLGWRLPSVK